MKTDVSGLVIDFNMETGELRLKVEHKMVAEALLGKGFIIGREYAHEIAQRILQLHGYLTVRSAIEAAEAMDDEVKH